MTVVCLIQCQHHVQGLFIVDLDLVGEGGRVRVIGDICVERIYRGKVQIRWIRDVQEPVDL